MAKRENVIRASAMKTPELELDLAVAIAIGMTGVAVDGDDAVLITSREWDEIRGIEHTTCEGDVACVAFQPSVDLNAAFAAAKKVFGNGFMVTDHPKISSCIAMLCEGEQFTIPFPRTPSRAATPALAICAAILKLKNKLGDNHACPNA